jgi:hypothetical protein
VGEEHAAAAEDLGADDLAGRVVGVPWISSSNQRAAAASGRSSARMSPARARIASRSARSTSQPYWQQASSFS